MHKNTIQPHKAKGQKNIKRTKERENTQGYQNHQNMKKIKNYNRKEANTSIQTARAIARVVTCFWICDKHEKIAGLTNSIHSMPTKNRTRCMPYTYRDSAKASST